MEFKHTQLSNGLTIIAEIAPAAASQAMGFFARTGARDESHQIHGVSHFLEHMMFKGTARRTAFDVNREFDEMGANYNAFTSEENTVYYAAVLPEFQARAIDLLADILRPSLRDEDFQTEKQVILEEIALYEDHPEYRLYEQLMGLYFTGHPLSRSVLGTTESIQAMTRDGMEAYFRRRYSPGNMVFAAAGNLDWDAMLDQVETACGEWSPAETDRALPELDRTNTTKCIIDGKLVRQHVGLMAAAPSAQSPRRYAAELTGCILGDHTGSRLYYALVEPAIAEEASCIYDPMDGIGGLLTFLSVDPARANEALAIARREIETFVLDGPTEAELSAAKNKIASASVLKGELPMGRLTPVGFEWVYRRTHTPLAKQIDTMMTVTAAEVLAVARDYRLTDATILGLGPKEKL